MTVVVQSKEGKQYSVPFDLPVSGRPKVSYIFEVEGVRN
jgi:hypothetical protein